MRITIDTKLQEVNDLIELIGENNQLQQIKQQLVASRDAESKGINSRVPKEGDEPYVDRME